ncbi:hypothetical protein FWK35_00011267 [Aphis craccivora]|uniref:Uncharacterized protein n=1 Tax=Aphis craccivora TaxID=307492 RepID=A0A6G0ZH67_APHCR|nr:hypothetical protein FWK35_00011267 [Aphis craccivora]
MTIIELMCQIDSVNRDVIKAVDRCGSSGRTAHLQPGYSNCTYYLKGNGQIALELKNGSIMVELHLSSKELFPQNYHAFEGMPFIIIEPYSILTNKRVHDNISSQVAEAECQVIFRCCALYDCRKNQVPNHTHKWQNRYLATTTAVEADFIRSGSTGRPCIVHRRNNVEPIPRTISLPDI